MVQICHAAELIPAVKPYFIVLTTGKHSFSASPTLHCFVGALFHVGYDNFILDFFLLSFLGNFSMLLSYLVIFIMLLMILFYFLILVQLLELQYFTIISAFIKTIP